MRTGRALLQAVEYQGHWVALLDWGSAALKLADREQWIGWTAQQRAERLKLVAMNRRFLVLGETRKPNLASRSLALAIRALPGQWKGKYGYSPVLAETFSDIEQFEGTCYKAAGWQALGLTQGFARHRMDYYQQHGSYSQDIVYRTDSYRQDKLIHKWGADSTKDQEARYSYDTLGRRSYEKTSGLARLPHFA